MRFLILALAMSCGTIKEETKHTETFPILSVSLEPCLDTCSFEFDSYFRVLTTGSQSGWNLNPQETSLYLTYEEPHLKIVEDKKCMDKHEQNCQIEGSKHELYLPSCTEFKDTKGYVIEAEDGLNKVRYLKEDKVIMICLAKGGE